MKTCDIHIRNWVCALLFWSAAWCPVQPENPGPHQPGWTQQTLLRNGRTLNCRIYYPAFVDGSEAPIDTLHGLYPVVGFGHGFAMQTSYYVSHFRHLATHGFVVIAPQFPDVQHSQLADDLLFCVDYIRQQGNEPSSRFHRLIDTSSIGLSGHSMGGGACLLAAARDSRIRVVAPLAPAETSPSAIAVMSQISGTVYLIAGGSDGITPPATNQIPMYNNAHPVKALCIILQANHTRFMDVSTFDFTDPNGTLTRPQQLLIARRYLTSALSFGLRGDSSFYIYAFGDSARFDPRITFSYQLSTTSVSEEVSPNKPVLYQNYPNPFNPSTTITYDVSGVAHQSVYVNISVFDMLGNTIATLVSEMQFPGLYTVHFDGSRLASGLYLYRMQADGFNESRKLTVLK